MAALGKKGEKIQVFNILDRRVPKNGKFSNVSPVLAVKASPSVKTFSLAAAVRGRSTTSSVVFDEQRGRVTPALGDLLHQPL